MLNKFRDSCFPSFARGFTLPNIFGPVHGKASPMRIAASRSQLFVFLFAAFALTPAVKAAAQADAHDKPQYPDYPSETPADLKPATTGFDYERRETMIPMRDGVRLHTVILVPKGQKNAPILLTRTPYSADQLTTNMNSAHLGPSLYGYDNATDVIVEDGYIRVV